jgi:transcriptional regulator with XRE-family HTH domain
MMNRIRQLREGVGLSQADLAQAIGTSQPQILRLEKSRRKLTREWAERLAPHLGVSAAILMFDEDPVPVVGYVRAGNEAIIADGDAGHLGLVDRPIGAPKTTVAVEVRGNSMAGTAEDGWLIYYDHRHDPPPERINQRALYVAGLSDGRVVVKKLRNGSRPGLYHLISSSAEPEIDVPVEWVAKVEWIKPR